MQAYQSLKQLAVHFTVLCAFAISATAQQPQNQSPDVIKVTTSLVQTDVMVFDKQGKFVDNLKREQFVLKVDGKPRDISFFERVRAGSANEEAQLAAARGTTSNAGAPVPLDRGRIIFFFIDDLHLSIGSLHHVRKMLSQFVDREVGQNDRVAIVSATGQIGFLSQLTDNKTVLRKAIERLSSNNRSAKDFDRPPMSEFQAELIDRNDRDILSYFVEALIRDGVPPAAAEPMVRHRASTILEQSAHLSISSLQTLRNLVRTAGDLPGRKLVFFVSDGFFVNARDSVRQRVNDLTTQAARSGVVIYSIDARGLVASLADASEPGAFDPTARVARANAGELIASQDGMNALAVDTGGRALFNTNDLSQSVRTGLAETSQYYLLAWRPDSEEEKNKKDRRLEVAIVGRPELVVRFHRNLADAERPSTAAKETPKVTTPAETLRDAVRAEYPKTSLPIHVTATFVNLPNGGSILASSVKIATANIPLEMANGGATAQIDLALAVLNDQGTAVQSRTKTLTLRSETAGSTPPDYIFYHQYIPIKPGLYQVRAAVAERKERRTGSANEWIEIPNLDARTLAMSSLMVAEKASAATSLDASDANNNQSAEANPFKDLRLSVDHRFTRDLPLRFLTFVYNATTAPSAAPTAPLSTAPAAVTPRALPDLAIQVQIFRDDQPVFTAPARKIQTDGLSDLARIAYAADVSLEGLQSGTYVLQVTVIDRIAKTTASQRFKFQVD